MSNHPVTRAQNGHSEDRHKRIKERMHSKKEMPGTGIGLAIVDRIVKKHGGKVWLNGERGKGATVFISL